MIEEPGGEQVPTKPRGQCAALSCRAPAVIELTHPVPSPTGIEPLTWHPTQLLTRRPLCRQHAHEYRPFFGGSAFGPAAMDAREVYARGEEEAPL